MPTANQKGSCRSPSTCYFSVNSVNVSYFNVRSLLPKIDNLKLFCSVYSPDIICVVETWLDGDILDSEISIQGYSIVRLDVLDMAVVH